VKNEHSIARVDAKSRREEIAEDLRQNGEASISVLAERYQTSEMTIRRDFDYLESQGLARRARGGAISVQSRSFEPPVLQRASYAAEAKTAIGIAAAGLVRENETIFLDCGTTTHAMARALPDGMSLTAITSSLLIAMELATKPAVRVLVTGGVIRPGEMSLTGARAQDSFKNLNCDAVYLGVAGISETKGLCEYNLDDAEVKRAAMESGHRVVVLADESKVGRVALVTFAPLTTVDLLVTNAGHGHPGVRAVKELDVEILHVVPHEKES